jgi:ferredoxin--NADP+ reductase
MTAMKIAIIGAGPAGCYTAQALRRKVADAEITVIDRLPSPYGLLRYGVAGDHQGNKAVIRQFSRMFEKQDVAFLGNLSIGNDLSLDEMTELFDLVVLATGLPQDRRLGVPGEDLGNIYGAYRFVNWLNQRPDAAQPPPLGAHVVVIGNGNVAMDVVRLLVKTEDHRHDSDLPSAEELAPLEQVKRVTVVGRSAAHASKFDIAMLHELAHLPRLQIKVEGLGAPTAEDQADPARMARLEALRALVRDNADARAEIIFAFGLTPAGFVGDKAVKSARFVTADGREHSVDCDVVITAVGFTRSDEDDSAGAYRVSSKNAADFLIAPGVAIVGWYRKGPVGKIADARQEAIDFAEHIASAITPDTHKSGRAGLAALINARDLRCFNYADWQRVDLAEHERAPENRIRKKFNSIAQFSEWTNSAS